jgi:hypothetical protein
MMPLNTFQSNKRKELHQDSSNERPASAAEGNKKKMLNNEEAGGRMRKQFNKELTDFFSLPHELCHDTLRTFTTCGPRFPK